MKQNGFTLVELVVVFSLIALLSMSGLASFVSFSQRQVLTNNISDLKTMLTVARTNTLSQYNASCTQTQQFGGYQVSVCCRAANNQAPMSNCPSCSGSYDYELYELCVNGNGTTASNFVQGKTLAKGVLISNQTTARTFQFAPITAAVTYGGLPLTSGQVILYLSPNQTIQKSTAVSSIGTIQ